MKLIIDVSEKPLIKLVEKGKVIAQTQWEDNFDLDTQVLKKIDALLKKKKMKIGDLKKAEVVVGEQRFTTARIAKAVGEAINITLK